MATNKLIIHEGESREIIIYRDGDNAPKVEVLLQQQNLWLTQNSMTQLFNVQKAAVSKHLSNIYLSGELQKTSTVSKMETVQNEGARQIKRKIEFYNLEAVIAVGYRVNSERAIIFRNWATKILKEYIQKGAVLDVERLKQPEYILGKSFITVPTTQNRIWV
jgi:hypothetical protein